MKRTEVRVPQTENDLPVIGGLDTKDGLFRVGGNRKLYLRILRQFAEHQAFAIEQIKAAVSQGDVILAERLAHTIKGVAGNIGAKEIQAAAGALEKFIRAKATAEEIESGQQQLAATLVPVIAQLQLAFRPSVESVVPEPAAPAVDPLKSREAAAQLLKLLGEFDPGSGEFLEANRAALGTLFAQDEWRQFEELVQGYSFSEAQGRLENALRKVPS